MKNIFFLLIIFLFSTNSLLAGGPWPQSKGKSYIKLSEWWVIYDKHYTDSGKTDPNVTTGVFNTSLYAEYGLTNRLTAILNAPLYSRNYMNNLVSNTTKDVIQAGEAINSIGDIDLGAKYGLTKPGAKFPISASLILGIPSGKSSGGSQNNLQTGDGEFNQMIQIDAGTGFQINERTPIYFSAFVGFNNRSKDFSEEFRYGFETGIGLLNKKLWLVGKLTGVESFKNGATSETITRTGIFANNTEFLSLAIEANLYLTKKLGISASTAGAFRGEIIAAAPSYSFGVFLDLSK